MITRRTFLAATGGSSLLAMSGLPSCAAGPAPRRFGPNDTIRLGFLGLRGRGNDLLGAFRRIAVWDFASVGAAEHDARHASALGTCEDDSGIAFDRIVVGIGSGDPEVSRQEAVAADHGQRQRADGHQPLRKRGVVCLGHEVAADAGHEAIKSRFGGHGRGCVASRQQDRRKACRSVRGWARSGRTPKRHAGGRAGCRGEHGSAGDR